MYGYVGVDNYELYHDLHGPDVCGLYYVSQGDVGMVPYWSEDEEGDVYEGGVALPRTGSDEPVNSVVSTSGPGGPVGPCDEESDFLRVPLPYPGPVPMSRSMVLLEHSARMAPVIRKVTFMWVMLPCTGPVWMIWSLVLLVRSAREAPVMRPGR